MPGDREGERGETRFSLRQVDREMKQESTLIQNSSTRRTGLETHASLEQNVPESLLVILLCA